MSSVAISIMDIQNSSRNERDGWHIVDDGTTSVSRRNIASLPRKSRTVLYMNKTTTFNPLGRIFTLNDWLRLF